MYNDKMLEIIIISLLGEYDLMNLIAEGAPYIEYEPEAKTILRYIIDNNYDVKLDKLAEKIQYTFMTWFYTDVELKSCILIANEIKQLI